MKLSLKKKCKSVQEIEDGNLILCLLSLCKALWCIVLSYYQVVCWHQKHPQNSEGDV